MGVPVGHVQTTELHWKRPYVAAHVPFHSSQPIDSREAISKVVIYLCSKTSATTRTALVSALHDLPGVVDVLDLNYSCGSWNVSVHEHQTKSTSTSLALTRARKIVASAVTTT